MMNFITSLADSSFLSAIPWDTILSSLILLGEYVLYILVLALPLLGLFFTKLIPPFIFRKLLHFIAFTSIFPLILLSPSWVCSLTAIIIFIVIISIVLIILQPYPVVSRILVEKGKFEGLISFLLLFGMFALFTIIFWGVMGESYKFIIYTSVLAWGPGDAMAAMIGIPFGKHRIKNPFNISKSWEGCMANFITTFVCVSGCLFIFSDFIWYAVLINAFVISVTGVVTEFLTKYGLDTVTVPLICSIILLVIYAL